MKTLAGKCSSLLVVDLFLKDLNRLYRLWNAADDYWIFTARIFDVKPARNPISVTSHSSQRVLLLPTSRPLTDTFFFFYYSQEEIIMQIWKSETRGNDNMQLWRRGGFGLCKDSALHSLQVLIHSNIEFDATARVGIIYYIRRGIDIFYSIFYHFYMVPKTETLYSTSWFIQISSYIVCVTPFDVTFLF